MSANTLNDLLYAYYDSLVNGPTGGGGTPITETIASWTGVHTLNRPASLATVTAQNNASAVGNGTSYDCGYVALATVVQITSSATLTAGAISIQNSIDNIAWADAKLITAATDFATAKTVNYSFAADTPGGTGRFWRVAITTTITGGTITAKIRSS